MRDILAVGQAGPDAHQLSVREAEEMMAPSVLVTNESERGAYPGHRYGHRCGRSAAR